MNLYQISSQYHEVFRNIEETGELNESSLARISELEGAMENKAIALASWIKNIEAERNAIEEARKEMENREKRLDKHIESLEEYLQANMERCGITEITASPYFTIKLKKCPPSVEVLNDSEIPEEYKRKKEVVSIDKIKLKEEIMQGVIVSGARIVQNNRLEIK